MSNAHQRMIAVEFIGKLKAALDMPEDASLDEVLLRVRSMKETHDSGKCSRWPWCINPDAPPGTLIG